MAAFGSVPKDEACDLKEIFTNYKIRKEGKKKKFWEKERRESKRIRSFPSVYFF